MINYPTELYHYGIKGRSGRYPYGSGNRPYQDREGSGRNAISNFIRKRKEKKKAVEYDKKRKELLEKRRKEEAEKVRKAADKERVLREGTATEILSYKGELSNQQLQQALERIRLTTELEKFSKKELDLAFNKMNDAMSKVKSVNDWASTGINTAKNMKTIMDMLDGNFGEEKKKVK